MGCDAMGEETSSKCGWLLYVCKFAGVRDKSRVSSRGSSQEVVECAESIWN